jgi:hypothetical protein
MMKALAKQSGVSFGGFIMVLALLGGLAIFGMKLIPAYMENGKVQKASMPLCDPLQAASVLKSGLSARDYHGSGDGRNNG